MPNADKTPPAENESKLHVVSESDKIPFWEKAAYGAGQIGNGMSNFPKYIASPLLVIYLGISPVLVSFAMGFFLLWDAISDPIMGSFSDNFRSRMGRRRPFIIIGAILSAILLPFIFQFDRNWSHESIIIYFLAFGIIFYTADTIFNMPYQSLLLEMTADYNERTSVSAFRGVLGKAVGIGMGWIWAFTQLPMFANAENGEADTLVGSQWASVICALTIVTFCLLPGIFCKERYYHIASKQKKHSVIHGLKNTLSCKPFLILLGIVMFLFVSQMSVNTFGIYLINYHVFSGDSAQASVLTGIASTISNVIGIAIVPFIVAASKNTSKDKVLWCMLLVLALLSLSVYFCYDPRYPWLSIVPSIVGVPLISAVWIIVPAMMADIVDYDELKNGERREGTFSAVFSWNFKAASTIAASLTGPLIVMVGFDSGLKVQAIDTIFHMKLMYTAIPIIGLIGCIILLRLYNITPQSALETRHILESKRGTVSE